MKSMWGSVRLRERFRCAPANGVPRRCPVFRTAALPRHAVLRLPGCTLAFEPIPSVSTWRSSFRTSRARARAYSPATCFALRPSGYRAHIWIAAATVLRVPSSSTRAMRTPRRASAASRRLARLRASWPRRLAARLTRSWLPPRASSGCTCPSSRSNPAFRPLRRRCRLLAGMMPRTLL